MRFWFGKPSNGGSYYIFSKLETSYPGTTLPYYPEIPILRLAEVYYVACETMIGKDNVKALGYLNDVRESRNLARLNGSYGNDEIMEFLMREMRKRFFIGEGRMFMIYKRLYKRFYVKQGVIIAPTKDKYIFPIPDDEYEFSPNGEPERREIMLNDKSMKKIILYMTLCLIGMVQEWLVIRISTDSIIQSNYICLDLPFQLDQYGRKTTERVDSLVVFFLRWMILR